MALKSKKNLDTKKSQTSSPASTLNPIVGDEEFLYRGVVEVNWDYQLNRPTSATFKDSKGVSVDRDGDRNEQDCIDAIKKLKNFYAICKVQTQYVRAQKAIVLYKPDPGVNEYHSEIHDSEDRIQLRGKKPKRIREGSTVVYREVG